MNLKSILDKISIPKTGNTPNFKVVYYNPYVKKVESPYFLFKVVKKD